MSKVYHYLKDNGEATSTELSEALGFTRRNITTVLKKLLDVGEVGKRTDSHDRRKRIYFKTRRNER